MAQSLDHWIAEAYVDESKDGACSMMSVVHAKGMAEQEVHTIPFGTSKKWTPKEIAELFINKMNNYAHDLAGVQLFYILAFYGGRNESSARKPYRVNGQTDLLESMGGTEGPTGTGLTQQAMRHTESMYQLSIKMQASAFSAMESALRTASEMATKANREASESRDIIFRMYTEKMEREFQKEMELTKHRTYHEIIQKGLALGPAIINQITGSKLLPQSTEDTALIEGILENMDEISIKKLLGSGAFPPVVMAMIAARGEKYWKEKKQKEESLTRINSGINAEKEVSGDN